ncbi:DUF4907 domain-containing protein [Flavobacterium sp. J27]|uniref:DUF4907 domain-containing protein n=1 Tax=Flavobacterium sp. J27 TaxID=2060419 RepID=UPI001030C240|nr:DUF4907 domain-containing protein [Flavobacterium sp. J27]
MIKKSNTIIYIIFVLVFELFTACKNKPVAFDGTVFEMGQNKYGYEVYLQGKLFIRQENIPAIEGTVSFKDSIDALRTLDLVLERLNNGETAALSKKDIQQLKIKI